MKHILYGLFFIVTIMIGMLIVLGGYELLQLYFAETTSGIIMMFVVMFLIITLLSFAYESDKKTKESRDER